MKKVFLFLFIILFFRDIAFADNHSVVKQYADNINTHSFVKINDAKIISKDNDNIKISFNFFNERGVQSGIKYSVRLLGIESDIPVLVDRQNYDDVVNLVEKQNLHKEIYYKAPEYLSGKYEIILESSNKYDFPLAYTYVGGVFFDGSYKPPKTACVLRVMNQENDSFYSVFQYLDIKPEESIFVDCVAENNLSSILSIYPSVETYQNGFLGDLIEQPKLDFSLNIKPLETNTFSFEIPKIENGKPGNYSTKITFLKDKKIPFHSLFINYSILGIKPYLQNIILDKEQYKKSDNAQVLFSWTSPYVKVHNNLIFEGIRNKEETANTGPNVYNIQLTIFDENNIPCSGILEKSFSEKTWESVNRANIFIERDCKGPSVQAIFFDSRGMEISRQIFETGEFSNNFNTKQVGYYFLFSLLIFLSFFFIFRFKKNKLKTILIVIIIGFLFLIYTINASAEWAMSQGFGFIHGGIPTTVSFCIPFTPDCPSGGGGCTLGPCVGGVQPKTCFTPVGPVVTPVPCSVSQTSGGGGGATKPITPTCIESQQPSCSVSNCGQTNYGIRRCDGTCSATMPLCPSCVSNYQQSCSVSNCGQTNYGTYLCNGACSATMPVCPLCVSYQGNSCTRTNNCGTNYGTYDCYGVCSATTPVCPPCVSNQGNSCNLTNSCGTTQGKVSCEGACLGTPPFIPSNFWSICTAKNVCGMENNNARIGCDGKCGPAPSDSLCSVDSGVRIDQGGGDIVKIAADSTLNQKSPVRIMTKDGVKSIPVTSNFNDPLATKIRIMTKDGVRALLKYISN